jgi:hypothetical protein
MTIEDRLDARAAEEESESLNETNEDAGQQDGEARVREAMKLMSSIMADMTRLGEIAPEVPAFFVARMPGTLNLSIARNGDEVQVLGLLSLMECHISAPLVRGFNNEPSPAELVQMLMAEIKKGKGPLPAGAVVPLRKV